MQLDLYRKYKKTDYTIGKLSINGEYICDTLEDRDRGLTSTMSLGDIFKHKVKSQTAIPTGEYNVIWKFSPHFRKSTPRLCSVPGFEGVLIHSGNTTADTEGCILPGRNTKVGEVTESKRYTKIIYDRISAAITKGERVRINIHW